MRVRDAFIVTFAALVVGILGGHWILSTLSDQATGKGSHKGLAIVRATSPRSIASASAMPITTEPPAPSATIPVNRLVSTPLPIQPNRPNPVSSSPRPTPAPTPTLLPASPPTHGYVASAGYGSGLSSGGGSLSQTRSNQGELSAPSAGTITLVNYWIGHMRVRPGQTVSLSYVIANRTGAAVSMFLGASLKAANLTSWSTGAINDPAHDVVAIAQPGTTTHLRYFTVPASLKPGLYDVAWGLRMAQTGQRIALVSSKGVLTIVP